MTEGVNRVEVCVIRRTQEVRGKQIGFICLSYDNATTIYSIDGGLLLCCSIREGEEPRLQKQDKCSNSK